ncbi:unnamed protein product [Rhizophagus irregularis]|nr:unnamed protein product [Rhizophagus irregularis]
MNENSESELIDFIIKYKLVKLIDESELSDIRPIDEGHFGIISKAMWKTTNNYVICKRLKNDKSISNKPAEAFIHELKMHGRLNFCQRIIRILGISLDKETKEYLLITEYADGGNLRQYLKNHFSELTWNDKIKLAYQITEGIKFLHGENILHQDLHSKNIVIRHGDAKIISLGIAKSTESQTNLHSDVIGMIAYIDPKRLKDSFYEYNDRSGLLAGRREESVPDTPNEYLILYKSCWDPEPNTRPSIIQVYNRLVKLGRMRGIQDFQNIECDDDNMQGIQDDNEFNNVGTQVTTEVNINNADIQDDNNNNVSVQDIKSESKTNTVYSAIWKDGPRIWNQQNEKYERIETKVIIKLNKNDDDIAQINEILNELKIYLDCHTQEYTLLVQFYGISKDPVTFDICFGLRPLIPDNIPKSFKNLVEKCWNTEPDLRPNIHEVYYSLLNLWSSIYHNKYPTPLNLICLEFIAADKDYSKSNFQEMITQKAKNSNLEPLEMITKEAENINLEPLEMIKYIKKNDLVNIRNINELKIIPPIDNDQFCKISKAILKMKKTDIIVACKRFKSTQLDRTFFYELKMHKKLYSCLRILCVLGISLDENTKEYLLIMQYADGGNLRKYLKNHFLKLTWNDKLKFAYQITEGIKYLHDEDVLHQNLHSKNILIHRKEVKIILDIAKNLYKSCWDPEPSERPSINQVFSKLGKMLYTQIKTNLKPEELIDSIRNNYLAILIININELSNVNGNITWEKKDSSFPVICKKYKCDQLNEAFIHKLKIYRKFSFCSRIVRIFGISLDINVNEFLLIMQYANGGNLRQYLKDHFSELTWDDKIKLAYQITEGIKFLHDADIIHQNLHPKNIVIHKKEAKIMLDIVKSVETDYFNDDEMISYVDPKFLENYSYELDKKSDIYSLGVLMWELSSGYPPEAENISKNQIINGYRETRIPNIPKEYFNLYESCWHSEPNARPTINQIFNKLEAMNKNSGLELFNLIKKHKLVKFINIDELSDIRNIDGGNFGIISKAIWKKTDNYVICKRLKNNESINNKPTEAFIHELKMHGRLNFCQRIIRILGISLDEKTKEYLLIMECADGGNLHQYLNNHFSELTWNDKIKLAFQITEGIKFLQGEKILHRDLHSGNIVVHQGEAKIIDLGIAKSGHREEPVPDTPDEYLKLYKSCWDPEPNKRPSISQVFSKLVKLGRMRGIQDFQDIKCDDDEVQGIQDNNVNDTDAQVTTETSNNGTIDDINHDLDIPG